MSDHLPIKISTTTHLSTPNSEDPPTEENCLPPVVPHYILLSVILQVHYYSIISEAQPKVQMPGIGDASGFVPIENILDVGYQRTERRIQGQMREATVAMIAALPQVDDLVEAFDIHEAPDSLDHVLAVLVHVEVVLQVKVDDVNLAIEVDLGPSV